MKFIIKSEPKLNTTHKLRYHSEPEIMLDFETDFDRYLVPIALDYHIPR